MFAVYGALVEELHDTLQEKSEDSASVSLEVWLDTLDQLDDSIQLSSAAAEAYYNLFVKDDVSSAGRSSSLSLTRTVAEPAGVAGRNCQLAATAVQSVD